MSLSAIIRALVILIIAIIIGAGIAAYRISAVQNSGILKTYGSWKGTTDLPLGRNDLVTTQVTLFALFALPSQEAVYLFAASDSSGQRFDGSSKYSIIGNINDIKADYWSITAYASDLYLIPNEDNRYSFNRENLQTDSAGNFIIHLSASKTEGNWLPVCDGKKFELVLRLYNGQKDFMAALDRAKLPAIRKL